MRKCGDCQLCCKLLPIDAGAAEQANRTALKMVEAGFLDPRVQAIPEWNKPAGEKCPHQRHHKGCSVYARRPFGCRFWNCAWLVNDDADELARPDRAHYVIDTMPDYVTAVNNETGARHHVQVVQIWLDPDYPDAHRDPALRAWLERRAEQWIAALVRLDARRAFVLAAPAMSGGGGWYEGPTHVRGEAPHSFSDVMRALGG